MGKDALIGVLLAAVLMLLGTVFLLWASLYSHLSGDLSAGIVFGAGVFFLVVGGLVLAGVVFTMIASRSKTGENP